MSLFAFTAAEGQAIWLSLKVSLLATVLALPLALLVAWLLARRRFVGHTALNVLVHLPLVLPPVVTGYLLLILLGQQGPLGSLLASFGITLAFRWTGAAVAAAVMAFPLMVRALRLAIEAVDRGLEDAAGTLGASPFKVFRTVTLPLIWPGILAAVVLGFAKAMGEFGATITFVAAIPGETLTVPSAIFTALQIPGEEASVVRLGVVSVILATGALVISELLARRR